MFDAPLWTYAAVYLALVYLNIMSVTLYLHRYQTHRSIVYMHPALAHFFGACVFLMTGMKKKAWVAVHRKHHAHVETDNDPHSPHVFGKIKVFFGQAFYYRRQANPETIRKFGGGVPDSWMERNIYDKYGSAGVAAFLAVLVAIFGWRGFFLWLAQVGTFLFVAGSINSLGHCWGYRNYDTPDESRNIWFCFFTGGEKHHNNHHKFPRSAKFSCRWWEFDSGWMHIRFFQRLGLVKRVWYQHRDKMHVR